MFFLVSLNCTTVKFSKFTENDVYLNWPFCVADHSMGNKRTLTKKFWFWNFVFSQKIHEQFIIIVFNCKRNPNIYILKAFPKEFCLCYLLKFSNPNIFETWKCKPFINWSDKIHSLKNQRATKLGCENRIVKIRVCGKDMIPYEHFVLNYEQISHSFQLFLVGIPVLVYYL